MYKDLESQMARFIKSGFKRRWFTNDLYEALYIHSNRFIAHFDKNGFYKARFESNAEETIILLCKVEKPGYRHICVQLANAMRARMHPVTATTTTYTVVNT